MDEPDWSRARNLNPEDRSTNAAVYQLSLALHIFPSIAM